MTYCEVHMTFYIPTIQRIFSSVTRKRHRFVIKWYNYSHTLNFRTSLLSFLMVRQMYLNKQARQLWIGSVRQWLQTGHSNQQNKAEAVTLQAQACKEVSVEQPHSEEPALLGASLKCLCTNAHSPGDRQEVRILGAVRGLWPSWDHKDSVGQYPRLVCYNRWTQALFLQIEYTRLQVVVT